MAAAHDCYNDELASVAVEGPLCNYLASFDGTRKDFDDVRPHFDDLFSDNLIHLMDGHGHPIGKSDFARINERLLERRVVATLEDIYFVDDTHVEYTVHWGNEEDMSMVAHILAVVADGKIIKMQPCEETKGAFAGIMSCDRRNSSPRNPLNQFARFRRTSCPEHPSSFIERPLWDERRSAILQFSSAYFSKMGDYMGRTAGSSECDEEKSLEDAKNEKPGGLGGDTVDSSTAAPSLPSSAAVECDVHYA